MGVSSILGSTFLPSPWIPHFHHIFDAPSRPPGISIFTWMSSLPVKHGGLSRQDTSARGGTRRLRKAEAEMMRTRDNSSRNEYKLLRGPQPKMWGPQRKVILPFYPLMCPCGKEMNCWKMQVPAQRSAWTRSKSCWVLRRPPAPLHKSTQGPYFTSCAKAFILIWDKIGALSQLSQIIPREKNERILKI